MSYVGNLMSWMQWLWCYTVAVMSYTMDMMSWIIVDVITEIQLVWYHQQNGCDNTDTVRREFRYSRLDVIQKVVWCPKEWKWHHIGETWCHECSVCEDIKHDHWCHKVWIWCDVDWIWCHMCAKCDDLHTCCDVIDRAIHRYRYVYHLCDDTDTVAVISNMVG